MRTSIQAAGRSSRAQTRRRKQHASVGQFCQVLSTVLPTVRRWYPTPTNARGGARHRITSDAGADWREEIPMNLHVRRTVTLAAVVTAATIGAGSFVSATGAPGAPAG